MASNERDIKFDDTLLPPNRHQKNTVVRARTYKKTPPLCWIVLILKNYHWKWEKKSVFLEQCHWNGHCQKLILEMGGKSEKSTIFDSQAMPLEMGGNHPHFSLTKNCNEMVEKKNIMMFVPKNTLKWEKKHHFPKKTRTRIRHPKNDGPGLTLWFQSWTSDRCKNVARRFGVVSRKATNNKKELGGGFKYFLFSSLLAEMIQCWLICFNWVYTTN